MFLRRRFYWLQFRKLSKFNKEIVKYHINLELA